MTRNVEINGDKDSAEGFVNENGSDARTTGRDEYEGEDEGKGRKEQRYKKERKRGQNGARKTIAKEGEKKCDKRELINGKSAEKRTKRRRNGQEERPLESDETDYSTHRASSSDQRLQGRGYEKEKEQKKEGKRRSRRRMLDPARV